jgi:hypothetical protein
MGTRAVNQVLTWCVIGVVFALMVFVGVRILAPVTGEVGRLVEALGAR